ADGTRSLLSEPPLGSGDCGASAHRQGMKLASAAIAVRRAHASARSNIREVSHGSVIGAPVAHGRRSRSYEAAIPECRRASLMLVDRAHAGAAGPGGCRYAHSHATVQVAMAPHVLVADDDTWILRMVSTVLEKRGYSVETALDGEDALHRALA